MDISNVLNPEGETVRDSLEELDELILAQFTSPQREEQDEELVVEPFVSVQEALEALAKLRLYQEQSGGDTGLILQLNRQERQLRVVREESLQQSDGRSF
ncbi:uncharacterized protein BCR38DRAFT_436292 [Pseudomassariella vexata]|uniref:Uncharacterized protein n=1 Tax=Pseudomassariella vexata TaxID=1141098 RepID=A0A1Y2DVC6_9PEZI|nr:uncharacterized protein BCR38DRAFT_436292 [Pseudomassariella vexata]ORY63242.1 hypothetical protein BCR38DRAFT_436292 [Pseudomassariella vexata]